MSSLFSSFYTAMRGIQNSQAELQTTGQNISNVSTEGYTRQRVDSYSLAPVGLGMRYAGNHAEPGQGVLSGGISQLRDIYLDIRYRSQNAKVGDMSAQLGTMNDIQNVIDESKTSGLGDKISDLVSALEKLSASPGDSVKEGSVMTSAELMTGIFNDYSEHLQTIWDQQLGNVKDDGVNQVNQLLSNIASLNDEIKISDINGASALELKDSRNQLLDKLSQYLNIEVSTKSVSVGSGINVEELSVNFVGGDGSTYTLIDNNKCAKLSVTTDMTQSAPVSVNFTSIDGATTKMNDKISTGKMHSYLVMLNGSGAYDTSGAPDASASGIPFYQKSLNTFASKLASTINALNSKDGSKPMFEASDGSGTITAANIRVAESWKNATGSYLVNTAQDLLSMIKGFSTDISFDTGSGKTVFNGTLQEFTDNLTNDLALQLETVQNKNDTFGDTLSEIEKNRKSISSVDVSEEGINLILYNQSLTASSRFMTTLDEAMDTIINKMGVVGR
ncbi:MAG: flagellar hook-associated protein FlgK [Bacillota bacterium]|nr:flagellar hook-associated protein FlgK [Bacillota bacterium]